MRPDPAPRTDVPKTLGRTLLATAGLAAASLLVPLAPAGAQTEPTPTTAPETTVAVADTLPGLEEQPNEQESTPDQELTASADTGTATGPVGQVMTVTPTTDLDPTGATVRVTGEGYDTQVGIYVALCVDKGPAAAPSPCIGGVDMEGTGGSSAWISSNPPPYGVGLAEPFGEGGTFDVELNVVASDEFTDCLDGVTRCVIASRSDHTSGPNRTADVKVPVTFAGQEAEVPEPEVTTGTITLDRSEVAAGGTVAVSGTGFTPGEQVQIWLLSDPQLIGLVAAGPDGVVQANAVIPATTAAGVHHIELRGMSSGLIVRSADLVVSAAGSVVTTTTAVAAVPVSSRANPSSSGTLPATGTSTLPMTLAGMALIGGGLALMAAARRRTA